MSGEPWQGGIIDDGAVITNNQNYINIDNKVVLAGASTYAIKGYFANKLDRTTSIVEAAVYLFLIFVGFAIVIGTALIFLFIKI